LRNPQLPAKVLYCESNIDGTIGGSHYCLLHLVENLDRSQFEPVVLFSEDHALVPRFRASAETMVCQPRPPARWGSEGRGLRSLPLVLARRAVNMVGFVRAVAGHVSFLRRHGIALVHQNNSITRHHDWMLASWLAGVPCVAHERGLNSHYSFLDRFYASRQAAIIPASRWIMDHMVARGVSPSNIRVMYDGLDPDGVKAARTPDELRSAFNVRPNQPVVGIVGNVREWKGQETVVRALIDVVKVHPEVVCFFVGAATPGDTPYRERLDAIIAGANIQDNVRFVGYQRDPASFVNLMTLVLHASVQPEPFGMVVLEAMAQHKPVIGSRAGGVVEMVVEGETGFTFPPGDAEALAHRMIELLDDRERAGRMGDAGYRRLVSSFTLQRYMNEIHTTYRAILEGRPVPADVGHAFTAKSPGS
jgi:glycosyltransferase involved in cell wall biosynthesis